MIWQDDEFGNLADRGAAMPVVRTPAISRRNQLTPMRPAPGVDRDIIRPELGDGVSREQLLAVSVLPPSR